MSRKQPIPTLLPKNWKRQKISDQIKLRAKKKLERENVEFYQKIASKGVVVSSEDPDVRADDSDVINSSTPPPITATNNNSSASTLVERHSLIRLFLDCYNNYDFPLLTKLLDVHCTPDVVQSHKYDGEKNPLGPDCIEVTLTFILISFYHISIFV